MRADGTTAAERTEDPGRGPAVSVVRSAVRLAMQNSRLGTRLLGVRAGGTDAVIDRALRSRHTSALVGDTMYRALLGRPATAQELVGLRHRVARGQGFDQLLGELVRSDESVDVLVARSGPAFRAKLRRQFAEADGAALRPRLVFLHIMKLGGTSLSEILHRWVEPDRARVHIYVDDLVLTPPPILAQLRFIAGHIPYGALGLIPAPFSTLCVLRDPYARTISHFTHLRAVQEQYRDLTLDEFVNSEVYDVPSGNYQARQLAHGMDITEAWRSYSPEVHYQARGGDPLHPYPVQSLYDSVSVGLSDSDLSQMAKANLTQIDYVGVTEDLDAVGSATARLFGQQAGQIPRLNTSPPIDAREIDTRIRRRIDERTLVDRELYEMALRRSREQD
jgi:hypothetical protein